MKSFDDLEFNSREGFGTRDFGVQATIHFPNNYGVSVIRGYGGYGNSEGLYELGILYDNHLCYDTGITEDVIGHLSPEGITEIMRQVQELGEQE